MQQDLTQQSQLTELWGQLNEVIGSSDGKKFRNAAQQMTLDVLLGYTNAHLKDLAKRYRLERVKDSLMLQVIDEETLPLYSKTYPYALLPDAISLNDIIDAFNAVEQDTQVGSDIWLSDDVLGWMYESYNNQKKKDHKDSGDKTEYNKVSLQSQVYTPRWVVQFLVENSLGKLYWRCTDSEIKRRYKIANAPESQTRKIKPLLILAISGNRFANLHG